MGYPRICAHRGFNSVAPENSLPAFGAAIALGADEIEFDVRFSADGVPVSVHDNNLERVANGSGLVEDFTFEELQQFDFGIKRGAEFSGLRILKFEEILRRFPRQCIMNIHVKTAGEKYFSREKMQKIIDLIYEYDCAKHVYFKAGYNVMEAALELAPEIHRCMGAEFDGEKMQIVENAIKYKCQKVQFFTPYFTQELIDYAHENGIKCNFFYTDDPDEARKLLDMGIDTILTNDYFRISQVRDAWLKKR
jgi:glycerophosphoryl diester phosphodiesterase